MALGYTTAARSAQALSLLATIDAGASAAKVTIYDDSGTRPASADDAIVTSVILAEVTLSDPSFSEASGVLTALGVPVSDADGANANGDAQWFRLFDGNGTAVMDGDVSTSGSDLNLNTITFTTGLAVDITSMVLTIGNP